MKRSFRSGLVIVLWLAVAAVFGSASYARSQQDKQALAQLTHKMKTVLGRLLIDLPAQAQIELGQMRINGFDISAFDESLEEFKKRLADPACGFGQHVNRSRALQTQRSEVKSLILESSASANNNDSV